MAGNASGASCARLTCHAFVPVRSNRDAAFLRRLHTLVQRVACDPHGSVERLAQAMHLNRSHLTRRVRQLTGQTPQALLQAERLQRARSLLRSSALSVADVASASGFADPSYFARAFRQATGLTPSAYRACTRREA